MIRFLACDFRHSLIAGNTEPAELVAIPEVISPVCNCPAPLLDSVEI